MSAPLRALIGVTNMSVAVMATNTGASVNSSGLRVKSG